MGQPKTKTIMLTLVLLTTTLFAVSLASSHSEAPGTSRSPSSDLSDFYLFRSPSSGATNRPESDKYVTAIANIAPLSQNQAGPNYELTDTDYVYQIHFDSTGDDVEDLSFQFIFGQRYNSASEKGITVTTPQGVEQAIPLRHVGDITNPANVNLQEYFQVRVATGRVQEGDKVDEGEFLTNSHDGDSSEFAKPYEFAGSKSVGAGDFVTPAETIYEQSIKRDYVYDNVKLPNCPFPARIFVGSRRESFSIALGKVFDLVNLDPVGSDDAANNSLDRYTVTSLIIEAHEDCLGGQNSRVLGAYASVRELHHSGFAANAHVLGEQVSRLANPLVNELIIPTARKNAYSQSHPSDDAQFLQHFLAPVLPNVIESLFPTAVKAPQVAREDVVAVQQQTRSVQKTLGFAALDVSGYPNGRRLGDDVVDISLKVLMGLACLDIPLAPIGPQFAGVLLSDAGICQESDVTPTSTNIIVDRLTDTSPINACGFQEEFPYLNTPLPGNFQWNTVHPQIKPQFDPTHTICATTTSSA